jgi:ADP-ribose pyrophosphatase YjhB (NUDIX family)
MEPKQVFRAYGPVDGEELANFCLVCGAALTDLTDGDRARRFCSACGFIRYRNPAPAVAVLVIDEDRFLLCRRHGNAFAGGKWCLPCGYVEYDEDYLTAAVREVQEETGLVVQITAILSVASNFLAPSVHTVVTVVLARAVAGEAQAGDDIEVVRWFSAAEELPDMAFEADRHIIARYFATRLAGAPVDAAFAKQSAG